MKTRLILLLFVTLEHIRC